jgi:Ca2+-binding RTX toxin-like protein
VSYGLAGIFIETLQLTGTAAINATGNTQVNRLIGNSAANVLDGMQGIDTMSGGLGDDTYVVDNAGDKVVESIGQGNDTIKSSVSYGLGGIFIETLQLTGTGAVNATGNTQVNTLIGNSSANVLDGMQGIDNLTGGAGADTFRFSVAPGAANADTITDFIAGTDRIALSASVHAGLVAGALAPAAFHLGTVAAAPGDQVIYDGATGRLWFDADGAGGATQSLIATLTPGAALTAGDILVI